jgi:hypothetical protein
MSIQIDGKQIVFHGKWIRTAQLEHEWYEDVTSPENLIQGLRNSEQNADVLTFWQRLPDVVPVFNYRMQRDPIAALPIADYSSWWEKQIDGKTRNMVRRAQKKGVQVRFSDFDDKFVEGMTAIFNETPIRQGKRFWHYGKDCETVKREFSRYLFREEVFGAYLGEELLGFGMLAFAGRYALLGQIISKVAHRDKAPNNILLAKAVERCAEKNIPYLVYAKWIDGPLGDFKRHNGFQKIDLPRYFVPLNAKGRLFLTFGLQAGLAGFVPQKVLKRLKNARRVVRERSRQLGAKWST